MTKSIKKIFYVVLTCVLLFSSMWLLTSIGKAYADDLSSSVQMDKGASVRISNDEKELGIRYAMIMSEEEYSGINKKVSEGAISDVSYGVLIAPAYYNDLHALNKENVFGYDGAKVYYNWAVDGKYTEETGKVRITNLTSKTLGDCEDKDGYVGMFASIVDLKPVNIANEFIGVGYIQYTLNGKVEYQFTDSNDNVRSMALVAQTYIEKNPNDECNAILQTAYLDKVANVDSEYTTEYYLENAEGQFVKADEQTETTLSKIGATATPYEKEILGYYFDLNNENNSVATKVLANDKTVLKLYYKKAILNADGTFYNSDFSIKYRPTSGDFNCDVPYGWTYTGVTNGWDFQTNSDYLAVYNWGKHTAESIKVPFEENTPAVAKIDAYGNEGYFNFFVNFYNEKGELINKVGYANSVIKINGSPAQTYVINSVSPTGTAYATITLVAEGTNSGAFFDNAKISTDISTLNEDGTFFNSNFSMTEQPAGCDAPKPFGWTYSHNGWEIYASGDYVRTETYNNDVYVYGPKLKMSANEILYVEGVAANHDDGSGYMQLGVDFYNANGELIETKRSADMQMTADKKEATYTTPTYISPENTAYVQFVLVGAYGRVYLHEARIITGVSLLNSDGTFFNSDFALTHTPADCTQSKAIGWSYSDNQEYSIFAPVGAKYVQIRKEGAYSESSLVKLNSSSSISAKINAVDYDGTTGKFIMGVSFFNANKELIETKWSSEYQLTGDTQDFTTDAFDISEGAVYVSMTIKHVSGNSYLRDARLIIN